MSSLDVAPAEHTGWHKFAGERLLHGTGADADAAALTRYIPGKPGQPLVVFLPGAAHHARIAYGGHDGAVAEDFLAHWLVVRGYHFLGIGYPLAGPTKPATAPPAALDIVAWGRQAADITAAVRTEQQLCGPVILLVWSNAGRVIAAYAQAAAALGLTIEFGVSLCATPPNVSVPGWCGAGAPAAPGFLSLAHLYAGWHAQIQANQRRGHAREYEHEHDIIPWELYRQHYVGDMPTALLGAAAMGQGLSLLDGGHGSELASLPLMTMILPGAIADSRHALTDLALWSPYLVGHLYAKYFEPRGAAPGAHVTSSTTPRTTARTTARWRAAVSLLRTAPQRLSVETAGNHFFFVGADGARATAQAIALLARRVRQLRRQLRRQLSSCWSI